MLTLRLSTGFLLFGHRRTSGANSADVSAWQSVCSEPRLYDGEQHTCCSSKTRTAARWRAPRRAAARLSGADRAGSPGYACHVRSVVYASPRAAMADAAASDRVLRAKSAGKRAAAYHAAKEGRCVAAARFVMHPVRE